jgi:hypothetical protein
VADLSCGELNLPRFFAGVGFGQVRPVDSTLATSSVYDVNLAYDFPGGMTLEVSYGLWDVDDRPVAVADSILQMRPVLVTLQLTREFVGRKGRMYLGVGAGYSVNEYDLGSAHRQYMLDNLPISDYTAHADDGGLMQVTLGIELYSTADAKLNTGIEVRHVTGDAERVEYQGSNPIYGEFDVEFWMLRGNISWHF